MHPTDEFASVATFARAEFGDDPRFVEINFLSDAADKGARAWDNGSDLHGTLKKSFEKECAHTEAGDEGGDCKEGESIVQHGVLLVCPWVRELCAKGGDRRGMMRRANRTCGLGCAGGQSFLFPKGTTWYL